MRIGITMRVVENVSYAETRDAISRDWSNYLTQVFPEAIVIPLLNQPERIEEIISELRIGGIIFSSGNDWGDSPERDKTERRILEYCKQRKIPVMGVCRGLQAINVIFGGQLVQSLLEAGKGNHVGSQHKVRIVVSPFNEWGKDNEILVNSYHEQGVLCEGLAENLKAFAITDNGIVEGFFHRFSPIMGIQWHPERKNPETIFDRRLIRKLFDKGVFWR